ncbi:SUMF1/EgtB/PvdO family nonheme iron enzyme [Cardinium endosymbiont of Nabis limbatus]|uniref:SUMF1/EgtB/PvdO family nonheme iron enzyme n=1 Tax=Cardinium endosymbiont of Nabis limbatus TaxID=3066217 RepID=UPI003AF40A27
MIFPISRLGYFFTLFGLVWITAYAKKHPTSARPGKVSLTTGRAFNQSDTLSVVPSKQAPPIPGMVYIEGGYMVMGNLVEDKLGTGGCATKPVTVTSFYIDKAPITNLDYREYLYDLQKSGLVEAYKAAIPNHQALLEGFSYNDPYLESYLDAPQFMYYPVVGVSWEQAMQYCKWRTKKFQELEIEKYSAKRAVEGHEAEPTSLNYQDIHSEVANTSVTFTLPSEAQWEYAARAIVGVASIDYLQRHQRVYPWDSPSPRGKNGRFLANFKRGKGNYKGMAGESDHAAPTSYVYAYPPNDLGIYDMVGNVCCWVSDTYDPLALQNSGDLNPVVRGAALGHSGGHQDKAPRNENNKVYKGCSWADSAYFLQIGTRRYLHKDSATATIGFRCVVSSLGR